MPLRQLQHSETPPRFPTLNALVTVDNVHFVNFSSVHFRWRMAKDTVEGGTRSGLFDFSRVVVSLKEMVKLSILNLRKGHEEPFLDESSKKFFLLTSIPRSRFCEGRVATCSVAELFFRINAEDKLWTTVHFMPFGLLDTCLRMTVPALFRQTYLTY